MIQKIFWPSSGITSPGILIGWRTEQGWLCVAASVTHEQIIKQSQPLSKGLVIVGECYTEVTVSSTAPSHHQSSLDISIQLSTKGIPSLQSSSSTCQLIYYNPPNPRRLRFLTLSPISLGGGEAGNPSASSSNTETRAQFERLATLETLNQLNQAKFEPSLTVGASSKGKSPSSSSNNGQGLDQILHQINQVWSIQQTLTRSGSGSKPRLETNKPPKTKELSIALSVWTTIWSLINNVVSRPFIPTYGLHTEGSRSLALKDVSAFAHQIHVRTSQARDMPMKWKRTRPGGERVGQGGESDVEIQNRSVHYINFYNTVWLIANDIIVGMTIGSILREQAVPIAELLIHTSERYSIQGVQAGLSFLDDWPVGLKLNTPLSRLYCGTLSSLAGIGSNLLQLLAPSLPRLIGLLSMVSTLGGTFTIAAVSDLFSLLTGHLRFSYIITERAYHWEMTSLYSLWNLFRGKRWNALRDRVDSYDYEIDQLFLGTLLFTISIFLMPTILSYYLYFAFIRVAILLCHAASETALAFMNNFPLFAVLLRIKEPSRLPGGVRFARKVIRSPGGEEDIALVLQNAPISFGAVFGRFIFLWTSLSAFYSPIRLLGCVVKGSL